MLSAWVTAFVDTEWRLRAGSGPYGWIFTSRFRVDGLKSDVWLAVLQGGEHLEDLIQGAP
jgi:hypothetical protein